jgi:hypothetical protein
MDGHEAGRIAMGEDDNNDGISSLLPSVVWHWCDGKKHQSNATAAEENLMSPWGKEKNQTAPWGGRKQNIAVRQTKNNIISDNTVRCDIYIFLTRAKPFGSKKEQEHCEQADKKILPRGGIDASKKPLGAKEPKQGKQVDKVAVVWIDVPKDMNWQSTGFEPRKWQPRALTKKIVLNNAGWHANGRHTRQKPWQHRWRVRAPLKGSAKRKTVSLRAYLRALRDRRVCVVKRSLSNSAGHGQTIPA